MAVKSTVIYCRFTVTLLYKIFTVEYCNVYSKTVKITVVQALQLKSQ